jgi:hypothetical protein
VSFSVTWTPRRGFDDELEDAIASRIESTLLWYHVKDQRRNERRECRSQIRDHDGFVLIVTMHMYTIYRRVGWFRNYLGRKDLQGYSYSISNYILCFLTSHISSIFRYNNIWLVTTRLTVRKQKYRPAKHYKKRGDGRAMTQDCKGWGATTGATRENVCTICLETFLPGEPVVVIPCNHMFHPGCLAPWRARDHIWCTRGAVVHRCTKRSWVDARWRATATALCAGLHLARGATVNGNYTDADLEQEMTRTMRRPSPGLILWLHFTPLGETTWSHEHVPFQLY